MRAEALDGSIPTQTGLLVVAHGSTVEWNDQVRQTVSQVRWPRGPMTSARIPQDLQGLPVRYPPAGLTPLPSIARWIERVAQESLVAGR